MLPKIGSIAGQTSVILNGRNLDVSLGGIYCKFNERIVTAYLISEEDMIICRTPAQTQVGNVTVAISLNNK